MKYRADIDGLRAVAVLSVLAFHAAPTLAPGGFVGVDIFFVISGYLITGIIFSEIKSGEFSLKGFFDRRVRRIAPAFLVVCAVCALAATVLFTPDHFELFGESLIASLLLHANFFFYGEAGYFSAPTEVMPLLHVWSLAVEEQFYLVFPIIMLGAWRLRLSMNTTICALAGLSFTASALVVSVDPEAAFYLPLFRAWELLLGSFLAVGIIAKFTGRIADISSAAGAIGVGIGIWGLSADSLFPSWGALAPCLGAALIIAAGPEAVANRLLSSRPAVWIGLISYSLYLWHWPLLTFGEYIAMRPLRSVESALLVATAFGLAAASYRYVERPFRRRKPIKVPVYPLFAGAAALLAIAIVADTTKGASWRLPAKVAALTDRNATHIGMPAERCGVQKLAGEDPRLEPLVDAPRSIVCRLGKPDVEPTIILWGDSHGDAMAPALDQALEQTGLAGYSFSRGGCAPLQGLDRLETPTWRCAAFADVVLNVIEDLHPTTTVVAARWAYYFEGTRFATERGRGPLFSKEGAQGNFGVVEQSLDRSLKALQEFNTRLVVVGATPEVGYHVPSTLGRAAILNREVDIAPTRSAFEERQKRSAVSLEKLAKRYDALFLDPAPALCGASTCHIVKDGIVLCRL